VPTFGKYFIRVFLVAAVNFRLFLNGIGIKLFDSYFLPEGSFTLTPIALALK
jgi:hypothetical protein